MTDGGLRSLFREHLPRVHFQSIETGMTGRGVPDTNGCVDGVEFWIEYKWTAHHGVDLRPEQVGWHMRRHRAGGLTFIAVRRTPRPGLRTLAADELYLLAGRFAPDLKTLGLRGAPAGSVLYSAGGGPASWDWSQVASLLTSPQGRLATR